MVVDSSAFVAVLLGEPEQEAMARVLAGAAELWTSASLRLLRNLKLLTVATSI